MPFVSQPEAPGPDMVSEHTFAMITPSYTTYCDPQFEAWAAAGYDVIIGILGHQLCLVPMWRILRGVSPWLFFTVNIFSLPSNPPLSTSLSNAFTPLLGVLAVPFQPNPPPKTKFLAKSFQRGSKENSRPICPLGFEPGFPIPAMGSGGLALRCRHTSGFRGTEPTV